MMNEPDYQLLFEFSPALFLVLLPDANFTIVTSSAAYNRATKTKLEEIRGHALFEIFPDNPGDPKNSATSNMRASLERVLKNRAPDTMPVSRHDIRRPIEEGGGFEEKYWSPVNSPVFGEDGRMLYIIHRVDDVTELKQLYQKQMELDQLKNQFVANVSHELRTPLTLILGPAEKWQNSPNITTEQRLDLELIIRNARTLLKTVNDLLEVSKLEAGKLAPKYADLDLAQLTRLTCSLFEGVVRQRKIYFLMEIPETLPAQCDGDMIQRTLLNLLSNAFKFVHDGGKVICHLGTDGTDALLQIQDNGPGIPKEMQEAIFDRFRQGENDTTGKVPGTGLGLSIAKEFVELHRGKINAQTAPGGGALFIARFPLRAPPGAVISNQRPNLVESPIDFPIPGPVADKSQMQASAPLKKGTILVVEDNPDMSRFISETLGPEFRIIKAFNGEEGLQKINSEPLDLVLTDIMMQVMSGDQMVMEIRKRPEHAGIPIVLLTAKADEDLKIKLLQEGAQDYVMKPFSGEELRARVRNLISIKRAREKLQDGLTLQKNDLEELALEVSQQKSELQKMLAETQTAKEEVERMLHLRDEFISIASHELNTPLTTLKMQNDIMKRKMRKDHHCDKDTVDFIAMLDRQIKKLQKLVESMLDVSRITLGFFPLHLEEVDLRQVVQNVLLTLALELRNANCQVELQAPSNVIGKWDPIRMAQMVENLLSNAIKYGQGLPIEIKILDKDGSAQLEVIDHGIGIATEDQSRIFNRFERAASIKTYPGLGMGLYITRQIVVSHGGSISVQSTLGAGTTFIVTLPKLNIH